MPRLFAALDVPSQTGFALSLLRGGIPGARWIDPEHYHVTLRFHGDLDGRVADDLMDSYEEVARGPVDIAFDGVDVFGSKMPHALIARVLPDPALMALQAELDRRALRLGLAADKRKFTPHVTLARLKNAPVGDIAAFLARAGGAVLPAFRADRFVMLSSRNSVGGGPYGLEAEYRLGNTGPLQDAVNLPANAAHPS